MTESYHVRLAKGELRFCAAHFITYEGNQCEPLHGHNYHVTAEVKGSLDENDYVIDFVALGKVLAEIVGRLDHRMLLPTASQRLAVNADEQNVEVLFGDRRWCFPRGDCVLLPLANTTAELLARYIGRELLDQLTESLGARPTSVKVEVDECDGQWAACQLENE